MKIDIVYTYVDGNDAKFLSKKNKFIDNKDINNNLDIRYENINEINYSIKTVQKYASWINKIYIVTDDQVPVLDSDIDKYKIVIIDHKDIIPEKYLPTFYSDVIESYLHNIPDLSEIFIYNNDDVFFLDYIYPEDIIRFNNDKIQIIQRNIFDINRIRKKTSEYSKRIIYTWNILKSITDNKLINNHNSKILRKSTLKLIEKDFEQDLNNLRRNKFRKQENIQYLFFAINIDNIFHNNIIIDFPSDCIEHHFGNTDYYEGLFYKFDITKKYKFCCYNSMNHTFTEVFKYFINHFL